MAASRILQFEETAWKDYNEWFSVDIKIQKKIYKLLEEIKRTPFEGSGKPEPLKHQLKGCWSRRIDGEHRLVYRVTEEAIVILFCKGHYTS
jgi:toxin YoeB